MLEHPPAGGRAHRDPRKMWRIFHRLRHTLGKRRRFLFSFLEYTGYTYARIPSTVPYHPEVLPVSSSRPN